MPVNFIDLAYAISGYLSNAGMQIIIADRYCIAFFIDPEIYEESFGPLNISFKKIVSLKKFVL